MTCPKCGEIDGLTEIEGIEFCPSCEIVIGEPNSLLAVCDHWWISYSMIYPGERVELWWSCMNCNATKDLLEYPDTPATRKKALKARKAHGN